MSTECGQHVVIEPDVKIGEDVYLGHHVVLKSGAQLGNRVHLEDHCCVTGKAVLGEGFNARAGCVISRGVETGKNVFFGANVTTGSTYSVVPGKGKGEKVKTIIGDRVVINSHVNIAPGVTIVSDVVVGAGSNVMKSITESGVYVGNPARKIR